LSATSAKPLTCAFLGHRGCDQPRCLYRGRRRSNQHHDWLSRFSASWLGKFNTNVQIIAITIIIFAASVPYGTGYYLPTLYAIVFALAILSGAHYVFFASHSSTKTGRQQQNDKPNAENPTKLAFSQSPKPIIKVDSRGLRYYITRAFNQAEQATLGPGFLGG
jgi:hypothetical protein